MTPDLTGQRFGKLIVLARATKKYHWICKCKCELVRVIREDHLVKNEITGCRSCSCHLRTHGLSNTLEYRLWLLAKTRATKKKIPFTISVADIVVPERCPLLGVPLERGTRSVYTASVDRINPEKGYIQGNVWVVSWRANQIKSNLTLSQFTHFVAELTIAYSEHS